MPVSTILTASPEEPHVVVADLVAAAQAEPLLWARDIGFTYYRATRMLVVTTDRVLEAEEQAALTALLAAHAGEQDG